MAALVSLRNRGEGAGVPSLGPIARCCTPTLTARSLGSVIPSTSSRPQAYGPDSETFLIGIGQAHAVDAEPEHDAPAGRLIVPDPEQRHGWREYWVPARAVKPGRRPIGFGR